MSSLSYQINKRDISAIFIILLFALLVRAAYFKDYKNTEVYPMLPYSDSYSYFIWANDISSGDVLGSKSFMKWPLYAYFLGLLFKVFGSSVALVYALQFMLGSLNCVLTYLIARIIFDRRVALLAALFCVWYALFVFYDSLLMYNTLSLFLNSLLFLFALHIRHRLTRRNLFWFGILLGICTITQASILIFGILAIIWLLRQNRLSSARLICNFSCFIAGLAIIIASVTLRNYLVEKDFVLIAGNTGFNFYSGNNPEADGRFSSPLNIALNQDGMFRDARVIAKAALGRDLKTSEVSSFWFNKSMDFLKNKPDEYLGLLFRKFKYLFSPQESVHDQEYMFIRDEIGIFKIMFSDLRFMLPFALLGILLGLRKVREYALLYLGLITVSLSIILFFVTTRYRLSMVPFLMIFAAFGVFSLWDSLKGRNYLRLGWLCLTLFVILAACGYRLPGGKESGYSGDASAAFHYHLGRAMNYNDRSDYQNAMQEIESAYQLQPGNHYCLLSYGAIYLSMHDVKKAEEKFKEAISVFPLSVDAYYNLGLLYNDEKRFEEAVGVLKEAVSLDPEDVGAHFELGKAYKSRGEFELARAEFELALRKINRWRSAEKAVIAGYLSELNSER